MALGIAATVPALGACPQHRPVVNPVSALVPVSVSTAHFSRKISPKLATIARKVVSAHTGTEASALSTRFIHINRVRQIQCYVYVSRVTSQVRQALARAGAVVEWASGQLGVYQIWASPATIDRIARLPEVNRITPPAYSLSRPTPPQSP